MVKFGENEAIIINDIDFKNKIIDYLFNTIELSKYRYNLLDTTTQLSYLKTNEHYISPNFKGYNYFLIFHKYNNIPYCAAVDRKNLSYHRDKIDIKKISIFKIKIITSQSIFRGTIMDCKLIKNMMMIKDCFQIMGQMIIDMDMLEKMIYIDSIIINQFQKDYCNNFTFKINKLYRYTTLDNLINNIIPKCNLEILGLVFFPKKSGVSIIFVDKRQANLNQDSVNINTNVNTNVNTLITEKINNNIVYDLNDYLLSRKYSYETNGKKKNLYIERTNMPDVYNVYETNTTNDKIGIAHIPSVKISQYCNKNIKEKSLCNCIYHGNFNKWIPLNIIE